MGQAPTTAITLGAFQHRSLPDETQFDYQRYAVAAARGGSNQPSDIDGTTANVWLNSLAAANSTTTVRFVASTSINLTAGAGHDIVTALKGTNTFTSAAPGTLTVTGGVGADAYRLGEFSQGITVNDFSLAKGDTLTVDNYFKGHSIKSTTDGAGGTFLDLADGPHHYVQVDLKGVIVGTNTSILPPWGEPPRLVARPIASWQVTHTSGSAIRQGGPWATM